MRYHAVFVDDEFESSAFVSAGTRLVEFRNPQTGQVVLRDAPARKPAPDFADKIRPRIGRELDPEIGARLIETWKEPIVRVDELGSFHQADVTLINAQLFGDLYADAPPDIRLWILVSDQ